MDYDAVKTVLEASVPFNRHLGIQFLELDSEHGVVRLPDDPGLMNHVGTQHACGLFAVAEAAAGAAFVGRFAEHMGEITFLVRGASIDYVALAKGPITATATVDGGADEVLGRVRSDGRTRIPATVTLADEQDKTVAKVTVNYHVKSTNGHAG